MNIEIHNPEIEQRVREQIQSGHFHDMDELLSKALDALREKEGHAPAKPVPASRKNLVEVCDPVRGFADDIDFSRNRSTARSLDL